MFVFLAGSVKLRPRFLKQLPPQIVPLPFVAPELQQVRLMVDVNVKDVINN